MAGPDTRLSHNDLVELRPPREILATLDEHGALDKIPFMPEMLNFYGQRLAVARRAYIVCIYEPGTPLGFAADDVVTLHETRCSGVAHGGCQKQCTILWREAWLRKVEGTAEHSTADLLDLDALKARLKVMTDPKTYFCQASEIKRATHSLSKAERLRRMGGALEAGYLTVPVMLRNLATWFLWRLRLLFFGRSPRGQDSPFAGESLNLQPGEWVEVRPLPEIAKTLDTSSHNRGLRFNPEMAHLAGKRLRVRTRLDKLIVDGTGQMRQMRNTVSLEGSTCGCAYVGFGMDGCARCELTYWREGWLRRVDSANESRSGS